MSGEVDDLVLHLIVVYNDKTYISAAESMTHQKGLHVTVKFILKVRGVKVIAST